MTRKKYKNYVRKLWVVLLTLLPVVSSVQSLEFVSEEHLQNLRQDEEDRGVKPALHDVDQLHLLEELLQLSRLGQTLDVGDCQTDQEVHQDDGDEK